MKKVLCWSLLLILIVSCSSGSGDNEENRLTGVTRYFPNFPEKQYKGLSLGDSLSQAIYLIEADGYENIESQPDHWKNHNWETEIIMPEAEILNEFKVFIYNENDVQSSQEFKDFFEKTAKESDYGNTFSVFTFETTNKSFTVTLFEQKDFLRLNYQLKTAH